MIKQFLDSKNGQIIISIVLGLGLAAVFRRVCTGSSCVVVQGPKRSDIEKYYYKLNGDCFKYTPYTAPCDKTPIS